MAYFLFLLANAALFFRPAELFPSLGDVQLYSYLIVGAIVCGLSQISNQLRVRTIVQQPINLCLLGLVPAVAMSHLSTGGVSLAASGAYNMLKVALYYLMLVAVVNSVTRLRQFLFVTAICSSAMIFLSVIDFHHFVAEWQGRSDLAQVRELEKDLPDSAPKQLRHVVDLDGSTVDGQAAWVFRLCGLGMFHDPNDLASLAVVTSVLALYFLTDRQSPGGRYLWAAPVALMAYAILLTHSRGGILAFGAGAMVWLAVRYGGKTAMAMGAIGACAVPLALGRQGDMELSQGTGQQRIQLWADGLAQLKSMKLPFGIGEGRYHEVAGLVAHNSYIHAFVELGFFGGMMFFGCFLFAAWGFLRLKQDQIHIRDAELVRMMPYAAAILGGWCTGMATLSRVYVPPTYMIVGATAAYLNLAGYYRPRPQPLLSLTHLVVQRWVVCSAALLAGCFLFVRLFARWS